MLLAACGQKRERLVWGAWLLCFGPSLDWRSPSWGCAAAPAGVRAAMELQAEAERRKRAQILESEGQRQSKINVAEGRKVEVVLASEGAREDAINRATGTYPSLHVAPA